MSSFGSGAKVFGWGSILGGAAGFGAGFLLAQELYSDEKEREHVRKTVKITACACGGAALLGILGTLLARR